MAETDRASGPAATAVDRDADAAPGGSNDASAGGPSRTPPTIDLTATELSDEATRETAAGNDPPDESAAAAGAGATDGQPHRAVAGASGIVTLVLAGAAGGLIALVALVGLWLAGLVPARDGGMTTLQTRVAALETQLRDPGNRPASDTKTTDELAQRLTALEQAAANTPRNAAADPALAQRIAAAEQTAKANDRALAGLNARIESQATHVAALEKTVADASSAAAKALQTASQAASTSAATAPPDAAPDAALAARLDTMERTLAAQAAASGKPDEATRRAVATLTLRDIVQSGSPFAAELSAVRALGVDATATAALAPLAATGLPGADILLQEMTALLPAMHTAAEASAATPGSGFLERLEANASRLVRIRPVGEAAGSDPAAILARIRDSIARGDLTGTLAQVKILPPTVRAPADPWIGRVEARQQALDASRRLAADEARRLVQP